MAWDSKQKGSKSGKLDSLGCDGLSSAGPEWGMQKEFNKC